jgi:hypothetical protein
MAACGAQLALTPIGDPADGGTDGAATTGPGTGPDTGAPVVPDGGAAVDGSCLPVAYFCDGFEKGIGNPPWLVDQSNPTGGMIVEVKPDAGVGGSACASLGVDRAPPSGHAFLRFTRDPADVSDDLWVRFMVKVLRTDQASTERLGVARLRSSSADGQTVLQLDYLANRTADGRLVATDVSSLQIEAPLTAGEDEPFTCIELFWTAKAMPHVGFALGGNMAGGVPEFGGVLIQGADIVELGLDWPGPPGAFNRYVFYDDVVVSHQRVGCP